MNASTKTVKITSAVTANEGANVELTVTLGRPAPQGGLQVNFTFAAVTSSAFASSSGRSDDATFSLVGFRVGAGQTTRTLTGTITNDALVEDEESFTVTVSTAVSGWAVVSGEGSATVTINDDDATNARIGFGTAARTSEHTISVAENVSGGTLSVPVVVSHNPQSSITIAVEVRTGGTAAEWQSSTNPGDFRIATKSVTFTPTGNRTQNLSVAITDDMLVEGDQTIKLRIGDSGMSGLGRHYTRHAMGRLSTVTINDNEDNTAKIAFGSDAASTTAYTDDVDEDVSGGTLSVPVTINHRPESSTTITVEVLATGSKRATEYADSSNPGDFRIATKSVTFTPGGGTTQNLSVAIENDDLAEDDQTIRLRIAASGSTSLGRHYSRHSAGSTATLTIDDDDADDAEIAFGSDAGSTTAYTDDVDENVSGGMLNVPVTVSHLPDADTEVAVAVLTQGTTATGADYTIVTKSVTFTPTGSKTQNLSVTVTDDMLVEEDQTVALRLADSTSTSLGRHYARHSAGRTATVTIDDDERPDAKIAFGTDAEGAAALAVSADEDVTGGIVDVALTINHLPESNTVFTVEVLETATRPATEYVNSANRGDYQVLGNKSVTFGPTGAKSKNVRVRLTNNALVEHPETVQLRIVAADATANDLGDHYGRNAQSRLATITINDDDADAAKIAFGAGASSTTEHTAAVRENVSSGALNVPVTISHLPSEETTIAIEVLATGSNRATEGVDYSIGTKSVTFTSSSSTSKNVAITLTDDELAEHDQTIKLRIVAADTTADDLGDYYDRDAMGRLSTVTIEDDEQRTAKIAFGDNASSTSQHTYTIDENLASGTFTVPVTVNHLPESSQSFMVEVLAAGTATENTDYSISSKTLSFGPSDTTKTKNLTITVTDDDLVEGDQTIALRIVAAADPVTDIGDYYTRHAAGARSLGTITDEDAAEARIAFGDSADGAITYRATAAEPATGQAVFNVPVTISHLPESSTTIAVRVRSGLATETTDYSIAAKSVTYQPSGAKTQNLAITLSADDAREGNETINLQIVAADTTVNDLGDHYTRHDRGARASVLVTDPDSTAVLRVLLRLAENDTATTAKTIDEGGTVLVYASLANSANAGAGGVRVTFLAAAGTTAADSDYRLPGAITIPQGVNFQRANLTIVDDRIAEGSEDLVLTAATSPGYSVDTGTITITDDDAAGVTVPSALSVGEGGSTTYQVRLDTQPAAAVTITPASADTDKATVSGPLTFTPANWSRAQRVTVTGVDQGEGTTMITHEATSADPNFAGVSIGSVTVTVTPAGKTLAIASATADEGGSAELAVTLGEAAPTGGLTLNVAYDYSGSTATDADTGMTETTITVPYNERTATLSVPIAADVLVEGEETFTVTISASGWQAASSGANRATVTITDDEATAAKIAFGEDAATTSAQTGYYVFENVGNRPFSVPVTVSPLPQSNTTFRIQTLTTGTGRASEGSDYTIAAKSITFGPSDTTMTKNVSITIIDDSVAEGNEEVRLRIASADNPANDLGDHYERHPLGSLATLTINDDDSATAVTLTASAAGNAVVEGEGPVTVTATLDRPAPAGGFRITLTAAGTATSPDDFTLSRTNLTIGTGATTASTTVNIVDDLSSEANETIVLSGKAVSSLGALPVRPLTLTIVDQDTPGVTVSESALSLPAGTTATYTVRLESPPTAAVTITPTSGTVANATVSPATLTFTGANWGDPQMVTVTGVTAGSATITHAATSSDTMYDSVSISSVAVTVNTPAKTFTIASATAGEGGSAELAVTLGEAAPTGGLTLNVAYDYSGSTATAADLGTTATTLTVQEGDWTSTLIVPASDDGLVEREETVTVTISASGWSAATTGAGTATVTITDGDAPVAAVAFGNRATAAFVYMDSVAEDVAGGIFNLPVTVSHRPQAATTFEIEVVPGGTATENTDYSIAVKSVEFGPSDSTTKNVMIRITADASVEAGETIKLRIAAADDPENDLGDYYTRHAEGSQASVTITDAGGRTVNPIVNPTVNPTGGPPGGPTGGDPPDDEEPDDGFSDLDEAGSAHAAAVADLVSRGVMDGTGCGGGVLCPRDPILRWEMAVWLVRVVDGQDPARPTEPRFQDVTAGIWWDGHVERLAQLGITLGCIVDPPGYCPDNPVTRAQMASFLVRAFELAVASSAGFEDTTGNNHQSNIDALRSAGITVGCSADPPLFCPRDPTTRAQMASFLARAIASRPPG
ncbi:MAG: hypothetical protein OXF41_01200 [bacterium]|nr:hypothetical protein [bacterium]